MKLRGFANRWSAECRGRGKSWVIPWKNGAGAAVYGDEGAVGTFFCLGAVMRLARETHLGFG